VSVGSPLSFLTSAPGGCAKKAAFTIHLKNAFTIHGKLYFDVKHLNRRFGIPALAKNIKNELRKIFGGNRKENTSTQQRSVPSNQNQEGSQHTNAGKVQNFDKELGRSSQEDAQNAVFLPTMTGIQDELKQVSNLLNQIIQSNISTNHQRMQYQRVMYPQVTIPPQFNNNYRFI
jgi:hypothetical protein